MTDQSTPDTLTAAERNFEGLTPRECGEHRTVGPHRAWCHDCGEWCYPTEPCTLCCRAPASTVDREALAHFVANAISRSAQQHVPVGYRVADALLSAGYVTTRPVNGE